METKDNLIFKFLSQVLVLFSIDILILILFAALFGDMANELSTMYRFGNEGLSSATMLQFLLSALTVTALRYFFLSESHFKNRSTLYRTTLLLVSLLITHIIYIVAFGWFSFENILAWIGFIICFIGGFSLGFAGMVLKTKLQNKKYDELLTQYKVLHEEEEEENE